MGQPPLKASSMAQHAAHHPRHTFSTHPAVRPSGPVRQVPTPVVDGQTHFAGTTTPGEQCGLRTELRLTRVLFFCCKSGAHCNVEYLEATATNRQQPSKAIRRPTNNRLGLDRRRFAINRRRLAAAKAPSLGIGAVQPQISTKTLATPPHPPPPPIPPLPQTAAPDRRGTAGPRGTDLASSTATSSTPRSP